MAELPELPDYTSAEAWLLSITDYEKMLGTSAVRYDTRDFDLASFRSRLSDLGDPHLAYGVIHVAGTKGKGSTCAMLESALRHCGFRTGLYTSPHLEKFTERIKVDGADMPDADFCRLVDRLRRVITPKESGDDDQAGGKFRTVFEILTAMAFEYFRENQVDVAIIETGLGGRLDATNVFDRPGRWPLVNVVTAIGMDHTAILGDTVAAIASEKAGIIRGHGRVVVSAQVMDDAAGVVENVVRQRCRDVGAGEPVLVDDVIKIYDADGGGYRFLWAGGDAGESSLGRALAAGLSMTPSLGGRHQAANAATVLAALVEYERGGDLDGKIIDPAGVTQGIEQTTWPGRFQVVDGPVPVVIDGAHCGISARALGQACRDRFADRPVVLITGYLQDKAGSGMLREIIRAVPVKKAIALVPPTPRAVTADHIRDDLAAYINADDITTMTAGADMAEAMDHARTQAEALGAYIVIFGSLYLVGPAIRAAYQ